MNFFLKLMFRFDCLINGVPQDVATKIIRFNDFTKAEYEMERQIQVVRKG